MGGLNWLGEVGEDVPGGIEGLRGEVGGVGFAAGPGVVEVEGGPMVDRPGGAMPDEEIRVGPCSVDVGGERVEPNDVGCLLGRGGPAPVVAEGAGEEVDAEVAADTGIEQILDLLVRFVLVDGIGGPNSPARSRSECSEKSPSTQL